MDEMTAKEQIEQMYFAAKEAKETAGILLQKSRTFYSLMESNSYLDKLKKMYRAYYGMYAMDDHQISFTGEQGEIVSANVNHFRNIGQHILNMITAVRPVMDARAINTDYKSLAQTHLANGILDYYMREKNLESALKKAVEMSIVLGSGFIKLEWNATSGEAYDVDPDTGEFNYEGELEFSNLSPMDVVVDGTKENWDHDWVLCRSYENRFNLMAKYPEYADKIKGIEAKTGSSTYRLNAFSNDDTDDVPVYEFYHKKTEAMPEGRYILFVAEDIILLDTKMPYRQIPVFRISPSDYMGTPYGYSPLFDLYPIQEMINASFSTIMTNQNAFGVQNIFVPRGADIAVSTLGDGMNIIEGNEAPQPLNLTATPKEVFDFTQMLIGQMETISGINSVTRGNPEASLKSGNALALVQSMALQFMSGLQQSYVKLVEETGTALINILKDFSSTPKLVALVGKNNRPLLKEFTGDNISEINRVVVDLGNPLARTIAGRVQMAEQMLQMNLLKSPQQYFQIIDTGRLDVAYEGESSELLLIKSENEQFLENIKPIVSPLDKHSLHITEHKSVLADPDLRRDPALVKVVLDHIEEHLNALRETDPALLAMIGEQPVPPIGGTPQAPTQNPNTPEVPGGSVAPAMTAPPAGMPTVPGEQIQGPGVENVAIPQPASPPGEFANLPTNPADMIPQ